MSSKDMSFHFYFPLSYFMIYHLFRILHNLSLLTWQNALVDPQRVRTPAITEYWKPLAEDVSTHLLEIY